MNTGRILLPLIAAAGLTFGYAVTLGAQVSGAQPGCTDDAGARGTADSLLQAAESRAAEGEEFAAANLVSRAQERFARSLQPGYFQSRPEFELWLSRAERGLARERP